MLDVVLYSQTYIMFHRPSLHKDLHNNHLIISAQIDIQKKQTEIYLLVTRVLTFMDWFSPRKLI